MLADDSKPSARHPVFSDVTVHLGCSGLRGETTICSICYDDIQPANLTYRHEPCGIAFDYLCLQEHWVACLLRKEEMKCPMCRAVFSYHPFQGDLPAAPLELNAEWHDARRMGEGDIPRILEDLSEEKIHIVKLVMEIAYANGVSPINHLILTYARVCSITNMIEDVEMREIRRGELVNEMDRMHNMSMEGELDGSELEREFANTTLDEPYRAAQLLYARRLVLHDLMDDAVLHWEAEIKEEETIREWLATVATD